MKTLVSIKDVVDEMDVLSEEHSAFLNRHTGELVTLSREELSAAEEDDDIVDYPEWQQEMIFKAKEIEPVQYCFMLMNIVTYEHEKTKITHFY